MSARHSSAALALALACAALICASTLHGVEQEKPLRSAPYASGGKVTGPIEISYRIDGRPAPGERLRIDLSLQPTLALTGLDVQVNCDEALDCASAAVGLDRSYGASAAGVALSEVIDVVPLEPGLHYVHVVATTTLVGNRSAARTLAIPIQVGEETQLKASGAVSSDAQGRRIVALPAD